MFSIYQGHPLHFWDFDWGSDSSMAPQSNQSDSNYRFHWKIRHNLWRYLGSTNWGKRVTIRTLEDFVLISYQCFILPAKSCTLLSKKVQTLRELQGALNEKKNMFIMPWIGVGGRFWESGLGFARKRSNRIHTWDFVIFCSTFLSYHGTWCNAGR